MPKHATDLIQRGSAAQHLRRQRVAKDMGPSSSRFYPGPLDGLPHQCRNGSRSHEWREWRVAPDENVPPWARRSDFQVPSQGLADLKQQRQPGPSIPFLRPDREFRISPVDVFQLERGGLPARNPSRANRSKIA